MEPSRLAAVARVAQETEVPAGESVTVEADFGHALHAVESGTAEVTVGDELVRTLGPGDVVGEIAVLSSGRRTASVVATTPLRLVTLFKRDVWTLERDAPVAASRLRELADARRSEQH